VPCKCNPAPARRWCQAPGEKTLQMQPGSGPGAWGPGAPALAPSYCNCKPPSLAPHGTRSLNSPGMRQAARLAPLATATPARLEACTPGSPPGPACNCNARQARVARPARLAPLATATPARLSQARPVPGGLGPEPIEISKQIFCEKIFAKLKTKKLLSKKIEIISTPLPPPPAMTVCLSSYRPPTRPQTPPEPIPRKPKPLLRKPEPLPRRGFLQNHRPRNLPAGPWGWKVPQEPPPKKSGGVF